MSSDSLGRWLSQLSKGSLEMAVLASLWDEKLYGLEILRRLAALDVADGTVYPLLNRLRKEGYLDSEWQTPESGHPRRYYSLSDVGRTRAIEMGKRWMAYNRELHELVQPLIREEEE